MLNNNITIHKQVTTNKIEKKSDCAKPYISLDRARNLQSLLNKGDYSVDAITQNICFQTGLAF